VSRVGVVVADSGVGVREWDCDGPVRRVHQPAALRVGGFALLPRLAAQRRADDGHARYPVDRRRPQEKLRPV